MAIRRGEIYLVNLNPVQGREQAGLRPVLPWIVNLTCGIGLAQPDMGAK